MTKKFASLLAGLLLIAATVSAQAADAPKAAPAAPKAAPAAAKAAPSAPGAAAATPEAPPEPPVAKVGDPGPNLRDRDRVLAGPGDLPGRQDALDHAVALGKRLRLRCGRRLSRPGGRGEQGCADEPTRKVQGS